MNADRFITQNVEAVARELTTLVSQINEFESILGLGTRTPLPTDASPATFRRLRARLGNLQSAAHSRIDPDEDWTQREPMTIAEFREAYQANRSNLLR